MSPHHFTQEDRIKLEAFLEAGLSQKAISGLCQEVMSRSFCKLVFLVNTALLVTIL